MMIMLRSFLSNKYFWTLQLPTREGEGKSILLPRRMMQPHCFQIAACAMWQGSISHSEDSAALFCIHDHTDARDWLVPLYSTGERLTPMSMARFALVDSRPLMTTNDGIIRIQICDDSMSAFLLHHQGIWRHLQKNLGPLFHALLDLACGLQFRP